MNKDRTKHFILSHLPSHFIEITEGKKCHQIFSFFQLYEAEGAQFSAAPSLSVVEYCPSAGLEKVIMVP